MEQRYGFFDDPDFLKKQEELKSLSSRLGKTKDLFSKNSLPNFNENEFSNDFEFDKLGIGKDPNYINPLTADKDADILKGLDNMGLSSTSKGIGDNASQVTDVATNATDGGGEFMNGMLGKQGGAGNIASSSVDFGMSAYTSASTTAQNEGESVMKGLDLTMKGAQAGMAIGGPVGAGVGAAAGFAYGVYDGFADANKRGREERGKKQREYEIDKTRREQEQRMKDGKDSLEKLTALRKAQLGYMI